MMKESKPCCRNLGTDATTSPFDAEVAFGYYDGPTSGILRCGCCSREFRFDMVDQRWVSEPDEIRIFELSPIPSGSIEAFSVAMSAYQQPSWPNWVPLWSFPSVEDRDKMNVIVDGIVGQPSAAEWVVANSGWLTDEILAARSIRGCGKEVIQDWFAFLGLTPAAIQD